MMDTRDRSDTTHADSGDGAQLATRSWATLYRLGAIVAVAALIGMLFDIALSMVPGWGTGSVPTTTEAWLAQFATDPLLGVRNLDLLNMMISLISLPMYAAIAAAHRKTQPALALLGLAVVSIGTAVFVANNAALPMLQLTRAPMADPALRAAAAAALLASGAHAGFGVFPGFILSEIGTLLFALSMLTGRVFSRAAGHVGMWGVALLAVYTTCYTFVPTAEMLVNLIAIPGGLLMIAWHCLVARGLWRQASARVS